ncbi:MAG: hypothetical protein LBJ00_11805, partial [Planctomycetaceae bacterium]|nr:hypothetical protein [Planctomycetaceae bacterium]
MFREIFDAEELSKIACGTSFIRRERRFRAFDFLICFVFQSLTRPIVTLYELQSVLKSKQIHIT